MRGPEEQNPRWLKENYWVSVEPGYDGVEVAISNQEKNQQEGFGVHVQVCMR